VTRQHASHRLGLTTACVIEGNIARDWDAVDSIPLGLAMANKEKTGQTSPRLVPEPLGHQATETRTASDIATRASDVPASILTVASESALVGPLLITTTGFFCFFA